MNKKVVDFTEDFSVLKDKIDIIHKQLDEVVDSENLAVAAIQAYLHQKNKES